MTQKRPGRNGGTLNSFSKGDVGNPFGRPKKFVTQVLLDLEALGVKDIEQSQVNQIYTKLLGLSKKQIKRIALDKDVPAILSITATKMLTRHSSDQIEKMLDRVFGKAVQQINTNQKVDMTQVDEKKKARVAELIAKRQGARKK